MANLTPASTFDDVTQIEKVDKVEGGAGNKANMQAQQLTNRTKYLKDVVDSLGATDATLIEKTSLLDADEALVRDSAAAGKVKKFTLTTLFAYITGKLYAWLIALTAQATLADGDTLWIGSAAAGAARKILASLIMRRTRKPDGATALYSSNFASTDGWNASDGAVVASGGVLVFTSTAASAGVYKSISGISGKQVFVKYKCAREIKINLSGASETNKVFPASVDFTTIVYQTPVSIYDSLRIYTNGGASGDILTISDVWVGAYSYTAGTLSEEAARIANQNADTSGVGAAAWIVLTSSGANGTAGKRVTVAGKPYILRALKAEIIAEGDVLIGSDYNDTIAHLMSAIRRTPWDGYDASVGGSEKWYWAAAAHPLFTCGNNTSPATIIARNRGIFANTLSISTDEPTYTLLNPAGGATTFAGGVDDWGAKAKAQIDAAIGPGAAVGARINRTSTNILSYVHYIDCVSGAQATLPAGGTWVWEVTTYGATYGGAMAGEAAGGAAITGTASANLRMRCQRKQ